MRNRLLLTSGVAANVQPTPLYEGQILQMFINMKEMKDQQVQSIVIESNVSKL